MQRPGAQEVLAYLGTHRGCGGIVKWAWLGVLGLPGPVGSFSTVNLTPTVRQPLFLVLTVQQRPSPTLICSCPPGEADQ